MCIRDRYLGIRTKANRFQFKHILYCFEPLYTVPYVKWCERTEINYSLFLDYYLVTGIKTNGHDFLRIVIETFYYVLTNKNESSMIKPLIKNRMIRSCHLYTSMRSSFHSLDVTGFMPFAILSTCFASFVGLCVDRWWNYRD